ncbi:hypothetical protein [Nocardia sp. NPDC058666]|uniref:hypothetical protein n=1 Tax=unclassified Nocardia TaxID=2637762 RepID=UPI00365C3DC6
MTRSVNDILDEGAKGLLYFEQLLPRYQQAFGGIGVSVSIDQIEARYDQERGMNLAKLDTAATELQKMLGVADTQRTAQTAAANSLGSAWQGNAAEAGIGRLREIVGMAAQDREKVATLATAMSGAVPALQQIIEAKANTVKAFAAGNRLDIGSQNTLITIGEITVVDIDQIIRGSKSGDLLPSLLNRLVGVNEIEDRTKDLDRGSDQWKQAVREICDDWLKTVFQKEFTDKLDLFNAQCATTRTAVQDEYAAIEAAAAGVEERSYPSVAGSGTAPVENGDSSKAKGDGSKGNGDQSQGNGGQSQGSGGQSQGSGGGTTAAGAKTDDTAAAAASPVKAATPTTDDSANTDTSAALTALTSTLSELGTTVSSALTGELGTALTSAVESVGTSIGDGIEQLTEQASGLLSGEHEASFQLGDTKVSIEAGENGLALTTTDANGDTQQYRLTLDENGQPVIEPESGSTSKDDSNGVLGSGTPESGTGPAEPEAESGVGGATPGTPTPPETPVAPETPVTSDGGNGDQSPGSVGGGIPGAQRPPQQESDGEHTPTVDDHPVTNPGDSGAVLAEAGPL